MENDLLELDEELGKTDKEFVSLLKKFVPDYEEKIKHDLSYFHKDKRYKLTIKSLDKKKEAPIYFNDNALNKLKDFCTKYKIDSPF